MIQHDTSSAIGFCGSLHCLQFRKLSTSAAKVSGVAHIRNSAVNFQRIETETDESDESDVARAIWHMVSVKADHSMDGFWDCPCGNQGTGEKSGIPYTFTLLNCVILGLVGFFHLVWNWVMLDSVSIEVKRLKLWSFSFPAHWQWSSFRKSTEAESVKVNLESKWNLVEASGNFKIFKFFVFCHRHLGHLGGGESSNEGLCFLDANLRLQGKLLDGKHSFAETWKIKWK